MTASLATGSRREGLVVLYDLERPRALLVAALAAVRINEWQSVRELVMLDAWLDSWSGLGAVVVGMLRQGYDVSLTSDRNGWRATFLHRSHVLYPWVGQVLSWANGRTLAALVWGVAAAVTSFTSQRASKSGVCS